MTVGNTLPIGYQFCNGKIKFDNVKFLHERQLTFHAGTVAPTFHEKVEFAKIYIAARGFSGTFDGINNSGKTSRSQP